MCPVFGGAGELIDFFKVPPTTSSSDGDEAVFGKVSRPPMMISGVTEC